MEYAKKFSAIVLSAALVSQAFLPSLNALNLSQEMTDLIVNKTPWETLQDENPLAYELMVNWIGMMDWLDKIENEDVAIEYTPEEAEKMLQWMIFLARIGIKPGDEEELEKDIEELLEPCGIDDEDCADLNYDRIRNLEDIPEYLKIIFDQE